MKLNDYEVGLIIYGLEKLIELLEFNNNDITDKILNEDIELLIERFKNEKAS